MGTFACSTRPIWQHSWSGVPPARSFWVFAAPFSINFLTSSASPCIVHFPSGKVSPLIATTSSWSILSFWYLLKLFFKIHYFFYVYIRQFCSSGINFIQIFTEILAIESPHGLWNQSCYYIEATTEIFSHLVAPCDLCLIPSSEKNRKKMKNIFILKMNSDSLTSTNSGFEF